MTTGYGICPICERPTYSDGPVWDFGVTKCRTCPYELHQKGSYACEAVIYGERFHLEEGYGDEIKFEERVLEWKQRLIDGKGDWKKEGF